MVQWYDSGKKNHSSEGERSMRLHTVHVYLQYIPNTKYIFFQDIDEKIYYIKICELTY